MIPSKLTKPLKLMILLVNILVCVKCAEIRVLKTKPIGNIEWMLDAEDSALSQVETLLDCGFLTLEAECDGFAVGDSGSDGGYSCVPCPGPGTLIQGSWHIHYEHSVPELFGHTASVIPMLRRYDGSVDFYLEWADYKRGFGHVWEEFWLGLDHLHNVTNAANHKVRVDIEDWDGNWKWAEYTILNVGDEGSNYLLDIGGYSGTAGDSFGYSDGYEFSSKDNDNDAHGWNCAVEYKGAWWYRGCAQANPTGLYLHGGVVDQTGVGWIHVFGDRYSFRTLKMDLIKI